MALNNNISSKISATNKLDGSGGFGGNTYSDGGVLSRILPDCYLKPFIYLLICHKVHYIISA